MKRPSSVLLTIGALLCAPHAAHAQLGEVHAGALASYGLRDSFGPGAGVVLGVAAGRVTYVGLRWAYHGGNTQLLGPASTQVEVTSRAQLFALDLGVLLPTGSFEIVPGLSFGVTRFAQRGMQLDAVGELSPAWAHDATFLVAPGLSVQARIGGFLLIPEVQYYLCKEPKTPWPLPHQGAVASMRIVLAQEVGRIRH